MKPSPVHRGLTQSQCSYKGRPSCADSGIFVREGGGGGGGQMVNLNKIYHFQGSRGVQHFPGGSNFFQGGGVQLLIPYGNPYNL